MKITPFLVIKNEEYWIGYVLRELCKVFSRVIVVDTVSTDNTATICKSFPQVSFFEYRPLQPGAISPAFELALSKIQTEWALDVNGDEYYEEAELIKFRNVEVTPEKKMGFVTSFGLDHQDGQFFIRGQMNANRIFKTEETRWIGIHPFETVNWWLDESEETKAKWFWLEIHCWHVRHLRRSSRDQDAYYRVEKLNFWQPTGWVPLERNVFEPIGSWPNPYLKEAQYVGSS